VIGWPLAQSPDFLPGLTLDEAAAGDSTLWALLVAIVLGLLVLVPSLTMLFRLVLSGGFDAAPAHAGEAPPERRTRRRLPTALVIALAFLGPGLTFVTEGGVGRLIGVVCLLSAVAAGAVYALAPERVGEEGQSS